MSNGVIASRRQAFSLVELVVVVAIIGILVGMLLVAVDQAMEAAKRSACWNNMRQMGIGLHAFLDANNHFPEDASGRLASPQAANRNANGQTGPDSPTNRSFYVDLLPFIDEANARQLYDSSPSGWHAANYDHLNSISLFVCPARRHPSEAGLGCDYGNAAHPHYNSAGCSFPVGMGAGFGAAAQGKYCIMGGAAGPLVAMREIVNGDGATVTLLLAHKSPNMPSFYNIHGYETSDMPWCSYGIDTYLAHKRYPGEFAGPAAASAGKIWSVHSVSMPCLWADGRVSEVRYGFASSLAWRFWSWNDGYPTNVD